MEIGNLKKEIEKRGRELITELRRQMRPPKERFFIFQGVSLLLILSNTLSQVLFLLGLAPTSMPKLLNGVFIVLQFSMRANLSRRCSFPPINANLLLKKLIFSPETSSNHRNTDRKSTRLNSSHTD